MNVFGMTLPFKQMLVNISVVTRESRSLPYGNNFRMYAKKINIMQSNEYSEHMTINSGMLFSLVS